MNRCINFIVTFLFSSALQAAAETSMFRGNAAHSGIYPAPAVQPQGKLKWSFKANGPIVTSAALANNTLFFGSDDSHVYALDLTTGKERWRSKTAGMVRSSPATDGELVYFGSYDGAFYAIDAATGAQRWTFKTGGERKFEAKGLHGLQPSSQTIPDFWDVYQSSPVLHGGRVYFGSGDGHLYAVEARTGALHWKFKTGDVVHSSPAVADDTVYFGSWDTNFYALDATTGEMKWKFKTGEDEERHNQTGIQSSPTVVNGVVYFGCRDANLYALDAATGAEQWKFSIKPTWINATPVVHDGIVYVGSSVPSLMYAIDAATGAQRQAAKVDFIVFSSAAIAGDIAYVGTFGGSLFALRLNSLNEVWSFQAEGRKDNRFGIFKADGSINFAAISSSNYFEQAYLGGQKIFSLGAFLGSPVVHDGVIYIGSTDGIFYAVE